MIRLTMFRRVPASLLTAAVFAVACASVQAQAVATQEIGLEKGQTPVFQISLQYDATHANAPPADCGCFWMKGGTVQLDFTFTRHWSAVADLSGANVTKINGTNERLSLFNYVFGPRYSLRNRSKYTPYAQALLGGSEVHSNYTVYGKGRTFIAAQAGGGLDIRLGRHLSVIPIEANWVFSDGKNGVNSRQNNTRLGAGITFRFDQR